MGPLAACTITPKRHLAQARVLAQSFAGRHPDIPFHVLLADEVDGGFDPAAEPFRLIELKEIGDPRLTRMRFHYRQTELHYACTALLLRHLLDRGFGAVAYFKLESLVAGDISPELELVGRHALTLVPHHLEPLSGEDAPEREAKTLLAGVYNVGFLGVSGSDEGRRFLDWWADRLFLHCRHEVERGLHYEQRWLNLAPALVEDIAVARDAGFNLGHWNFAERALRSTRKGLTAQGRPCRYVRFSGYDYEAPEVMTRYSGAPVEGPIVELFAAYHERLRAAGHEDMHDLPYAFDQFDNGVEIPQVARRIYQDLGEAAGRFGDPFETGRADNFYAWLRAQIGRAHV